MGALYELFNTFTILFYSWVMYQVFYNLPVKYKMVSFQKLGSKRIGADESASLMLSNSQMEEDNQLDEIIAIGHIDTMLQREYSDKDKFKQQQKRVANSIKQNNSRIIEKN